MRPFKLVWVMVAAGLLAGCLSVVDRRISKHPETWRGLSEQDQSRLRHGAVRAGDTEDMVAIALGPPDKTLTVTGPAGQKQTTWLYDLLEFSGRYNPFDPNWTPHLTSSERSVVFQDGAVVKPAGIAPERTAELTEIRVQRTTEMMEERLGRLVALTSGQRARAREIFAKANEELYAFSWEERPEKGRPIRVKMRADIRAMLTPEQQALYDVTPQYLGGGSTKRQ